MNLELLKKSGLADLRSAESLAELETARVRHLGRKAPLSVFLRDLKNLSGEERRKQGAQANALRRELEELFSERKSKLSGIPARHYIDITRPAPRLPRGHVHPLTLVQEDVGRIFSAMGFKVLEGPEVETEYNNFDALNIPKDHPARDLQDTFWLKREAGGNSRLAKDPHERFLLRTQTSTMQIRYMETHEPPLRIVVPGRVFRHEATDMTHDFQFHQVEGLAVGPDISMANLKGVMEHFFREFFRDIVQVRFVQRYFPFTEPSVEVEIKGKKGRLKDRWIEVAGAGMVHQNVFKAVGYVPGRWQGFAFGMAIERIAMLKYKIDDIRLFHGGDIRFLEQF